MAEVSGCFVPINDDRLADVESIDVTHKDEQERRYIQDELSQHTVLAVEHNWHS